MFITPVIIGAVALYMLIKGTPKPRGHEPEPVPTMPTLAEERFQRYHTQPPIQDAVAPIYNDKEAPLDDEH